MASTFLMTVGEGGAPAVAIRNLRFSLRLLAAGSLAMEIKTVGAAQKWEISSSSIKR